jgi:hypothetical protein
LSIERSQITCQFGRSERSSIPEFLEFSHLLDKSRSWKQGRFHRFIETRENRNSLMQESVMCPLHSIESDSLQCD